MSLDNHTEPKGAYYTPALIATFTDEERATQAIESLRAAGFSTRDIDVARTGSEVKIVVSEPQPGMIEQARALLAASPAIEVRPYGAGADDLA